MCCGTTAYALRLSARRQAHVTSSDDNTKQDGEYISSAIVRFDATFRDAALGLLSYLGECGQKFGVGFIDMRKIDVVEDVVS